MNHPVINQAVGQPLNRVEGVAKVTGQAKYTAEHDLPGMTYGVMVTSTITKGHITKLDTKTAEQATGVLGIISHLNCPEVPGYQKNPAATLPIFAGQEFKLFQDSQIHFNMQPVALVIADTFERAQHAASLVKIAYSAEPHHTDIHEQLPNAIIPAKPSDYTRGQADAWQQAPVKISQQYETSLQVHNPMEPHATIAYWPAEDKLMLLNKSNGVKSSQQSISQYFELPPENIQVISEYVGGAFGSSSRVWPQEMAAVLGAKKVGKPVKAVLARNQVFNMVGYRPYSLQKFSIGAQVDGTITGIAHKAYGSTSSYEQFNERIVEPTKSAYNCINLSTTYKLVPLDVSTPCPARGPGETSGSFALESAMDELAYALKMDPLELRLKNFANIDLNNNKPWSSNHLKECYQIGAEKFGWSKRNPVPRSMQRNGMLMGWGMSMGIYKAERAPASASVRIQANSQVFIRCSVADTGPGSITILTQIAADALGVDVSHVTIEWGNADYPMAPPQFASHTTASTGSAVHDAAIALKQKFTTLANTDNVSSSNYTDLLRQHQLTELEATVQSKPGFETQQHSGKSFSVNFIEIQVHPTTGMVKVNRIVSVIDAGKIMNHKTARSQVLGSAVWGIGIALMEQGVVDHRYGRYVNNNLAEYHVPVNADIPQMGIHFIDKADNYLDPMGAKGLGEVGLIGFTAAIANAVYHATGKRIRQLPITPDKLL
ncbi:xanthine dehydrogenase family protein molybdopterin-binding subunit [Mucilaginibacter robiniae]|uniref:Xanthine dehydrogenase family protein molybdopterin-binding subunit n=1 Tax=Mucilaginibacter robiniae TaxID=2728022 RepID=A0A7L5E200_9SPHI|nr:xanthine dehydrogenase family protein molybdopterin-binding subunit [Mucilaginibacter robiniae]QJD94843.1 xanthine dehydrogenase family protein molybdopterin-binding subunit [Mucilaginibacter robiniae]